jgi:hypothetical protein
MSLPVVPNNTDIHGRKDPADLDGVGKPMGREKGACESNGHSQYFVLALDHFHRDLQLS